MKQFLVVLLILGAAAGSLAQEQAPASSPLRFSLLTDFRPSLMQYSSSGNTRDIYTTTNRFNFLTHPGDYATWGPWENELKLSIDYNKNFISEHFISGHLRMNMDGLVRAAGGFVANDGKQNNRLINDVLNTPFDEWNVQGTLGPFYAFVGNTANRGIVRAWQGIETIRFKQEQFGVVTPGGTEGPEIPWDVSNIIPMPTPTGNWQTSGKLPPENANFGKALNTAGNYDQEDIPYFIFRAKYNPFSLEVSGDLTPRSNTQGSWSTAVNGGLRFSGEKIADLVTFDLTYKFRGGDMDTYNNVDEHDPAKAEQPDGKGQTTNSFTLAGQLGLLDDTLGIQLAYTGVFRAYEDMLVNKTTVKQTGPFISGIDLRLQYTGLDQFQFNFNNHVTFSSARETKYTGSGLDPEAVYDFWGLPISSAGDDTGYDWFALYNALGAQYRWTDKLNLWFEVGNKLSKITTAIGEAVRSDTYNIFGASLKAVYTVNSSFSVEGGLAVYYATYNWKINDKKYDSIPEIRNDGSTPADLTDITTNQFVLQVPLRLRIVY